MSNNSTMASGLFSILGIFVGCCIYAAAVLADESAEGAGAAPQQQAYDACRDKKAGEAVQFATRSGLTTDAVCTDSPGGLYAKPEHRLREHETGAQGQG